MAAQRGRLDAELVRRKLTATREAARKVILVGRVRVGGFVADKPARMVLPTDSIVLQPDDGVDYVSRGAHKLLGALAEFRGEGLPDVDGRLCLDVGASTGGFTEVLLNEGAEHVVAVDVGYGQIAWRVRTDPRVTVMERTNARYLGPDDLPYAPQLAVIDVSFISLRLILPALAALMAQDGDILAMVKPQFELGREAVGKGGVVRDPAARALAVASVSASAAGSGLGTRGIVASPLPGPAGNVEYFLWLSPGGEACSQQDAESAVREGPA
ncbi:MAG: TlyA family RNA methyltransferase [Candidatus Nanopelagicales bacterium]|nr:TlyA family RNA methyltransferase [Candidatus Nanopelagicales bacterium]